MQANFITFLKGAAVDWSQYNLEKYKKLLIEHEISIKP